MAHIQLIGLTESRSPDGKIWKFPYSFPIIIRQLLKTPHSFGLLDTHFHKKDFPEVLKFLEANKAKIYGISAYSHNYLMVKNIAAKIRSVHKDAVIIVGGLLALNDEVLMNATEVDIASTSPDGEFILPEILDALTFKDRALYDIRGITFKDRSAGRIVKNAPRPTMSNEEFQRQEMPAYEYFDEELKELSFNINSKDDFPVKGFPLLTMRGCPFDCTFCGHLYGRKFLRKSWRSFFDEIDFLIKRYDLKGIYSFDTNLFLNAKDVDEFSRIYEERKFTFKLCIEMRTELGNFELFRKLKNHGVRVVLLSYESGSQKMLDRMKKGYTLETMRDAIRSGLSAGLLINGNFIFGTPGENKASIRETRKFMFLLEKWFYAQGKILRKKQQLGNSGYGWSVLIAAPSSELYGIALQQGLIKDEEQYLISLSSDTAKKLLRGSQFKIALAQIGGDVNMSDFSSKKALLAYVKFSIFLVKLRALFFQRDRNSAFLKNIFLVGFSVAKQYFLYIVFTVYGYLKRT